MGAEPATPAVVLKIASKRRESKTAEVSRFRMGYYFENSAYSEFFVASAANFFL